MFSLNNFIFLISSFLKTHFEMKAVAIKKQCFEVSEIIFKVTKVILGGRGGVGGCAFKSFLQISQVTRERAKIKVSVKMYVFIISLGLSVKLQSTLYGSQIYC